MKRILLICTGNTCRSALAEGIARARLDPGTGVVFESAGLYALDGAPATPNAAAVAAEMGVDLSAHRARSVTPELLEAADRIYVMTRAQAESLARLAGGGEDRVSLLYPDGQDIPDPYGGDLDAYRAARDRIIAAVEGRREEWQQPDG